MRRLLVVVFALLFPASYVQAGLIINPTFDDVAIAAAGFVVADVHSAFQFAANEFQGRFSDNIHVNINVTTDNVGLGQSTTNLLGFYLYAQVQSLLT